MYEEFTATAYPKVQENLKLPTEGDVRLEDPASSAATLESSISGHASTTIQASLPTSTATTAITTTTLPPPSPQPQQGISNSIIIQRIGELERSIADQVDANQALEERLNKAPLRAHFKDLPTSDMKEILLQRMLEENYDKGHKDHRMAYEALQKSSIHDERDASGDSGTTRASDFAQDPLLPPQYPTTNLDDQSLSSAAPACPRQLLPTAYTPGHQPTPDSSLWPSFYSRRSIYCMKPLPKTKDCKLWTCLGPFLIKSTAPSTTGIALASSTYLTMEECHKLLTNQVDDRLLSKGDRLALLITKMKAVYYPDVGLEQMVLYQMWIEEECMYDISATYGISHWWFKRQKFYINRHSAETNQRAIVRTHMRILSVIKIEDFLIYGYDYMKKIVLRRADNQEYTIAENDFKDLYPSDFEDLYLLNLQGHLNHLPPRDKKILSTAVNLWIRNLVIRKRVEDFQLGIESYQTQLNLTKPRWEATGLEFMHDYKILDSPRAVLFRDKYGMQMLMRFNEIHKFSDGTLQQIDEALDYRVKEFKVNKNNPALNTRFWTTNDVIKCKQFMFAIQKRLKLRRIFQNLESFVGGRIREGDYRLLWRTE
ncbi:hypothetical protein Tco_0934491 [Tanacetum coccineum]